MLLFDEEPNRDQQNVQTLTDSGPRSGSSVTFPGAPQQSARWKTLSVPAGDARLKVPAGWEPASGELVAGVEIVASSTADGLSVSVTRIRKSDATSTNLDQFAELVIARLPPSIEVSHRMPAAIQGQPAIEFLLASTEDGINASVLTLVTQSSDSWWIVEVWAAASRFVEHEEMLRRVCYSFRAD